MAVFWKRVAKAVVLGEMVLLLGAYRVWHQMNTSRGIKYIVNLELKKDILLKVKL